MAIRTKENTRQEGKVPPIPRNRYTVRVLKATYGRSKGSDNKMITLECEIADPTELEIDGTTYAMDSFKFNYYLILVEDNGHLGRVVEVLDKLELQAIDDELIDTDKAYRDAFMKQFDNLTFDAILTHRERVAMKKDTINPKKFVPIVDPATNKPLVQGYEVVAQIGDVLCRSTFTSNKPY